jgi:probable rRNA maturation factor
MASALDRPPEPDGRAAVLVSDRQDVPVDVEGLVSLAQATLSAEGVTGELSISFVDETEMADLHVRYLDEPGPTDVLSFAQDDDQVLGDVVICAAVAARNNPADPAAELRLLLVHGILHLLGHDHEEPEDKAAMWAKQERYSGVRAP